MQYNFDKVIDRKNTYSTQWDYIQDRFGRSDILPFSISDTDFPVSDEIQNALEKRISHNIYGYTRWNHADFKNSIKTWFEKGGNTMIDTDWIVYSPSVIYSVDELIRMNSKENDNIAVFTPMYDAFYNAIGANNRVMRTIKLDSADQGYGIDWSNLENILKEDKTKIFLLTNPHNPTGKVFTKDELTKLVKLCEENNVFIISDDIHRDLIIKDEKYTPITNITIENIALCCSSSKTFNTPGLIGSYLLIPDGDLREKFLYSLKQKNALSSASIFGLESTMAGYNKSQNYVDELVEYLKGNYQFLEEYIKTELPELIFERPESTYLAWINVSNLNLSSEELQDKLVNNGHVGIMPGSTYGDENYIRMNIGCPKSKLEEGLYRVKRALKDVN